MTAVNYSCFEEHSLNISGFFSLYLGFNSASTFQKLLSFEDMDNFIINNTSTHGVF